MASKPIIAYFTEEINKTVDKFRDEGVSYAEIIGVLEVIKFDLCLELTEEAEEDLLNGNDGE